MRRYTDQSFDQEFFSVLQRASLQCIRTAGSATLEDIASYLRDKVCTRLPFRAACSPVGLRGGPAACGRALGGRVG